MNRARHSTPAWSVLPRLIACVVMALANQTARAQQGPPATVAVSPVTRASFAERIEIVGEAEAFKRGRASSEVEGLILRVDVEEGQEVERNQVIVQLKDDLLKIRERGAVAQLDLARQQLLEYQRGSRPEEVREARARVSEAEALKKESEEDLDRIRKLESKGAATAEDLTAARAKAEVARAVLDWRKAVLDRTLSGPRKELISRAEAQVAIRTAELDELRDELKRTRIRAPFKGVVTSKLLDVGNFVKRGDAVLELIKIDPVRVVVPVPEAVIGRVKPGLGLAMRFDALREKTFEGKIEAIIPTADIRARTFPVKVVIPNPGHVILPGMVARIAVPVAPKRTSLAVPRDAITRGPQGATVWIVRNGTAIPVPVRCGASRGTLMEVQGDLQADEQVVVRGNERLRPGQRVVLAKGQPGPGNGNRQP